MVICIMIKQMIICVMIKQIMICIIIRYTLIFKFCIWEHLELELKSKLKSEFKLSNMYAYMTYYTTSVWPLVHYTNIRCRHYIIPGGLGIVNIAMMPLLQKTNIHIREDRQAECCLVKISIMLLLLCNPKFV